MIQTEFLFKIKEKRWEIVLKLELPQKVKEKRYVHGISQLQHRLKTQRKDNSRYKQPSIVHNSFAINLWFRSIE